MNTTSGTGGSGTGPGGGSGSGIGGGKIGSPGMSGMGSGISGPRLGEDKPGTGGSQLREPLIQPSSMPSLTSSLGSSLTGVPSSSSTSSSSSSSLLQGQTASGSLSPGGTGGVNAKGIESLLMFFARTPIESNYPRPTVGTMHMFKGGPALTVQTEEHVTRVFAKLVTEGFLSAPVLNEHRTFCGFIDMLDIVTFTVRLFEAEKLEWNQANWEGFWNRLATFRDARVKEVMNYWGQDPRRGHGIKKGFSLLHAMEAMARDGVHRVAVLDDNSQVCGISTQSMMVSLISQHINQLGTAKDTQIRDMYNQLGDELLTVVETQRALDAFKLMSERRVNGVAVVNARGALVDVISVRDLRCMGTDAAKWWRLFETVHTFKMLSRIQYPHQTPRRPLYVNENDTFHRLVELMDDGNIHRVIQVAEMPNEMSTSDKPIGISATLGGLDIPLKPIRVISQRDAIRFTLKLFGLPAGDDKYSGLLNQTMGTNMPVISGGGSGDQTQLGIKSDKDKDALKAGASQSASGTMESSPSSLIGTTR